MPGRTIPEIYLLALRLRYENPYMGFGLTADVIFGPFADEKVTKVFLLEIHNLLSGQVELEAGEVRTFGLGKFVRQTVRYKPLSITRGSANIISVTNAEYGRMQKSLWRVLSPQADTAADGNKAGMLDIIIGHMVARFAPLVLEKYATPKRR